VEVGYHKFVLTSQSHNPMPATVGKILCLIVTEIVSVTLCTV